jgi:hypothetical protein
MAFLLAGFRHLSWHNHTLEQLASATGCSSRVGFPGIFAAILFVSFGIVWTLENALKIRENFICGGFLPDLLWRSL